MSEFMNVALSSDFELDGDSFKVTLYEYDDKSMNRLEVVNVKASLRKLVIFTREEAIDFLTLNQEDLERRVISMLGESTS